MYTGTFQYSVDTKGRLTLPSKLRDSLGEQFVVTKGIDGCLFVYDKTEWADFEVKLNKLSITDPQARKVMRFFLAGAIDVELDKQGRFILPPNLREYADIQKDIVLMGCGKRVEIWDKQRFVDLDVDDNVNESMNYLNDAGVML